MNNRESPSKEALIAAMGAAWRDHHHARDQTWKVLQIEAILGAGLVTVDAHVGSPIATAVAAALVIIASAVGTMITVRHRDLERRKFIHIMNCEEALGLHRDDLIPLKPSGIEELGLVSDSYNSRPTSRKPPKDSVKASAVGIPKTIKFRDVFNLFKANTSLFILRMHVAITIFAFL